VDTILSQEVLGSMPREVNDVFEEVYFFLFSLGYKAKEARTKDHALYFMRKGKKIAKFAQSSSTGEFSFHIRFDASREYSEYFNEKVKKAVESFYYRYAARISHTDIDHGYIYQTPDGVKYWYWPEELIDIGMPPMKVLPELKKLLATQAKYWETQK
jgi:hypothetical protein